MFHFLEVEDYGAKLSVDKGRLLVQGKDKEPLCQSFDDLDAVILTNPAVSLSGVLLSELGKRHVSLVVCDRTYTPISSMIPLCFVAAEHDAMLEAQIGASLPFKKSLWQKLVKSKISGQATVLNVEGRENHIGGFVSKVHSGDPDNIEGRVAAQYWKTLNLFPRRDRLAEDANQLLNYAYTVVFSAFARYVCASSLHPHLGLHHHNQYNPFCLASDLMEPYRAFADMAVLKWVRQSDECSLTHGVKEFLVRQLYDVSVKQDGKKTTLFNAIRQTVVSFKRCLQEKDSQQLLLPTW